MTKINEDNVEIMEAGELELRKAFEEVTKGNVLAAVEHANETRRLLRQVQEDLKFTNNNVEMLRTEIGQVRNMAVQALQTKYAGGTENIINNDES